MNPAEKEIIENFCRELALVLRRVTGRKVDLDATMLPTQIDAVEPHLSLKTQAKQTRRQQSSAKAGGL